MKKFYSFGLIIALFLISCQPGGDDLLTIQGEVRDSRSGATLPGTVVQITSPQQLQDFTSTDSSGTYMFDDIDISEATDITLRVSQTGYDTEAQTITAVPGDVRTLNFELTETDDDTPGGGDDPGEGVEGEPGLPAAIILDNVSETSINIRQTGGKVTSSFSFVVRDSAGRRMNEDTPVMVNFRILKGPDGGEEVVPDQVETNAEGSVVTNLFSGDSAGVVRVEAFIDRQDGERIASSPIIIAINGGFPAPDRFFVAAENYNLEGYGFISSETEYPIIASVGDKYGNPVKEGTAVDFRTEAGRIDGSAITDDRGFAVVNLSPDGDTPGQGTADIGFFNVTAKTVDENNDYITKNVRLLFTTREAIITFTSGAFNVPANGSDNVSFTVTDLNGRPMAAGTTITVESAGSIEVTGDSEIQLGNYFTGGPGITDFTVTLTDLDPENSSTVSATVTVNVQTPSGNQTTATLSGNRAKVRGN